VIAAPRAAAADQRIYGVVIGIVEDVEDEDELNRVLISLPWYAEGYRVWARVCQIYAANGSGSTWIPDPRGEVLVAFLHGDMRWPYVLGALHGPVDKPPVARTASTDVRTFLTPSGSELRFDETNGTVDLRTKSGASINLDEQAGTITLESKEEISIKAPSIAIEGTTDVALKAPKITIEATGEVSVSGKPIRLN
jgi:uncharacterized protein involved in type VI secretion and phage assembly